jgi:hypothetical protein
VCAVPGIEKYSYVWCAEIDVTFKGNLTKWLSDVRVADPKADFITWHASPCLHPYLHLDEADVQMSQPSDGVPPRSRGAAYQPVPTRLAS